MVNTLINIAYKKFKIINDNIISIDFENNGNLLGSIEIKEDIIHFYDYKTKNENDLRRKITINDMTQILAKADTISFIEE